MSLGNFFICCFSRVRDGHSADCARTPPREDWRRTNDEQWRTVSRAGDYVQQRLCVKQVRWPDGAVRWTPVVGYCPSVVYSPNGEEP